MSCCLEFLAYTRIITVRTKIRNNDDDDDDDTLSDYLLLLCPS